MKSFTKQMMLALILSVGGVINAFAIGEVITTKTVEGVNMRFEVISDNPKQCQVAAVFGDYGTFNLPSIDENTTGTVTIPESVMGYSVTTIGESAFRSCSKVEEFIIPSTVKNVLHSAFASCKSLKKCWLPESLGSPDSEFGWSVFFYCESLTDVYLPNNIKSIPDHTFYYCTSLEHIEIPASVTFVDNKAFYGCEKLEYVTFMGDKCLTFGSDVFTGTPSWSYDDMTGSSIQFVVPYGAGDTYQSVINDLFSYTEPADIWDGLNNNRYGFKDRSALDYMVKFYVFDYDESCVFSGFLEDMPNETFTVPNEIRGFPVVYLSNVNTDDVQLTNLKKAVVPGTCKSIGNFGSYSGFAGCTNLSEIELQEGVEEILYGAFDATGIKELHMPMSLESYNSSVHNCPLLTDVYFPKFKLEKGWGAYFEDYSGSSATVHVPFGAMENYADMVPNEFAKIEEDAAKDGDYFASPFKDSQDMWFQVVSAADKTCRVSCNPSGGATIDNNYSGTVDIPKTPKDFTVLEIGEKSFYQCKSITGMTIPNTVTTIGSEAFAYCEGLVAVNVPASVEVIGANAFSFTKSLMMLTLKEGLKEIGMWAFSYSNITTVVLPSTLTSMGEFAFESCHNLTEINIPESLETISAFAFEQTGLTTLELPTTVKALEWGAFRSCYSLKDVTIHNSKIKLMGLVNETTNSNEAFWDCAEDAVLHAPSNAGDYYQKAPWTEWFSQVDLSLIPTGISAPQASLDDSTQWATISGMRLSGAPTKPGLYIRNGQKVMVR